MKYDQVTLQGSLSALCQAEHSEKSNSLFLFQVWLTLNRLDGK